MMAELVDLLFEILNRYANQLHKKGRRKCA